MISLHTKKVDYAGPASLDGLNFGGIKGHRYADLEERFGKSIKREDVYEEMTNIKKVASSKIDVTIMANSTYHYLAKQMGAETLARSNLYLSPKAHAEFERHIFVAPQQSQLAAALQEVVTGMAQDTQWQQILQKYGLK